MKENYTIKKALKHNLLLIKNTSKDLAELFKDEEKSWTTYTKIGLLATILLDGLASNDFNGAEKELFDATLPMCQMLCKTWHAYLE